MSTRKNTNNECPSNALADLNDNTISFDEFINSKQSHTTDRFGNKMDTLYQITKTFKQQITDYTKKLQSIENGERYIPKGGYGVGGLAIRDAGDGSYPKGCQFISIPRGAVGSPLSTSTLIGMHIVNHSEWGLQIIGQDGVKNPKVFVRTIGSGDFVGTAEFITSANSTVDSNGFLKAASPILRLFASDDVNPDDGFIKAGFAHVNDEAKNAYAKKIAIGHYEIHGSLGFAKEGWYITLPEDANGNKKFFADYSVDENNIITIKTYTRKFDTNRCEIVAGDPIDITEGRWIDVRLDMMVNDPPYKQSGE